MESFAGSDEYLDNTVSPTMHCLWDNNAGLGMDNLHTGQLSRTFFPTSDHTEAENLGPKLHPRGGFFGPWFFIILKNSHQDLSNEGSNFILSSL